MLLEDLRTKDTARTSVTSISFLNACPANFLNAFSMMSGKKDVIVIVKLPSEKVEIRQPVKQNTHEKQMLKPQ